MSSYADLPNLEQNLFDQSLERRRENEDALEQQKQRELALMSAFASKDAATIDRMLDDKCFGVGILGAVYDKKSLLETQSSLVDLRDYKLTSFVSNSTANSAVNLSTWQVDASIDSVIIRGAMRVTRVWFKSEAGWKVVSFHVTDARLGEVWDRVKAHS